MIYEVCFSAFTMVLLFLRGERRRLGAGWKPRLYMSLTGLAIVAALVVYRNHLPHPGQG
ncbi:hypothetical protein K456DRAFT_1216445 [Colletotrichum gloeosporioides 23]|nr:hypothetical protein K456DRAFT_1216445 [Colletotrichum gloeosporioides 23]